MTVSATLRLAGPFNGDGSTTVFPFTFKVFEATDLAVETLNTSSGAFAALTLDSDYSVALNADQDASPGGSITLLAGGLAVGLALTITTAAAQEQSLDLTNGGGFYPDVINNELDAIVILIQQLQMQLARAIQTQLPDTASMVLPAPALRAGKMLMFDANGNIELVPIAGGSSIVPGAQTAAGNIDTVNRDFTFVAAAGATPSILVFAGGVFQDPSTDYSAPVFVSGTNWKISFTTPPANGPIKILMLG